MEKPEQLIIVKIETYEPPMENLSVTATILLYRKYLLNTITIILQFAAQIVI